MKRSLFALIIALLFSASSFAQLTGMKTIPGDYPSVATAIAALNSSGVGAGGVTFTINGGYTETFTTPTAGFITTLTGSAANPIVFVKSVFGSNPVITAPVGTGTMDAIIAIAGCDYVTFDGINLAERASNTTATPQMEWGFALLKASATDGSQNITIKNCTVNLDKTNTGSIGIYSNNHTTATITQLTLTNIGGANSNLKIFGNTVDAYFGIWLQGYNHTASPYAYFDQNNEIGKDGANFITNVGGGSLIGYGIYTKYQNNLKVANNSVTSNTAGSKSIYGIYLTTANNASYDLYNNTISIQFNTTDGNNSVFNAIYADMGASGTTNVVNVYNNTVTNCTFPTMAITGGTNNYSIYIGNGGVTTNVYNNTVSNNTFGSGTVIATGPLAYIRVNKSSSTAGPLVMHHNTVSGNSRVQSVLGGGNTYFIWVTGSGTTLDFNNNLVDNNAINSSGTAHCINIGYTDNTSKSVYENIVSNITGANGSTYGLYNSNGKLGYLYRNKIQNISSSPGANSFLVGINHSGGTTMYYYNNMISQLSNPGSVSTLGYDYVTLIGINAESSGTFKGFYNNTVYLNASPTSATFGSAAFSAMTLTGVELRNNIFVNTSTSTGAAVTLGMVSRNASVASYTNFTSNYNNIYAGTPGPSNKIFAIGSGGTYTIAQTLADYKSLVNQDLQSVTELPPFVNIATSPYSLKIQSNINTQIEAGGIAITTPLAITTDFENEARFPNIGYPVNGSFTPNAPDLGADEFGGLPNDITPPAIVYTPFTQTSSFTPRTLTATITDGSGVPTTGAGLPVLYWKLNSGAYQAVQGLWVSGSTYTFTFGAATAYHDLISYYIVAQDMATVAHSGAFPWQGAAGFTTSPPACSTPPTTPSSYLIIQDISGIFHVGIGKDYATLTAAANDLNDKFITGAVTLYLDDNTYPSETYPILFNSNPGNSSTNKLTIKPNPGATPVLSGSSVGTGLIIMNGLDYVTVDGSNVANGTDKSLTIENTSSTHNSYTFGITNNGGTNPSTNITVKNTILKGNMEDGAFDTYVVVFNGNGGTAGGGYDNCTFSNNTIMKSKYGMYLSAAAGNMNHTIQILNNTIGSSNPTDYILRYGIAVEQSDATLIQGNDIMGPANGTNLASLIGIVYSNNATNTKITANNIHDWYSNSASSMGIKSDMSSAATASEISNNLIYNIKCNGLNPGTSQSLAYGIMVRSGGNIRILHNTIYLSGPFLTGGDSFQPSSAGIGFMEWTTGPFDIRNNIIRNSMTNIFPNPPASAEGKAYAIMTCTPVANVSALFSQLDYNDYFIDGYNASIAMNYGPGGTSWDEYTTLAQWQAVTGKESHTITINPGFVSDTDLHPTNYTLNTSGIFTGFVPKDFSNVSRKNPPDMGAYEWSAIITDYHTLPATNIAQTSAQLNADMNTNGEVVETYILWDNVTPPANNYGIPIGYNPSQPKVRSTTLIPLNAPITGLTPNTTYYFQLIGFPSTSSQAMISGAILSFTTLPLAPVVVTTDATSITTNDAQLNGTVNPNGVSATVTIQYGLTTAYGNTVTATPGSVSGSSASPVMAVITGLNPYNTYHYRVVATNFNETVYGNDMTFTTLPVPSIVTTLAASNIVVTTATLNGSVNANYAPTDVTFEWGLTTAYGNTANATPLTATGNTITAVSADIDGLATATTYHFRCVGNGPGGVIYGEDMQFNSDCPTPANPGVISGSQSVCKNSTGVVYSVAPVSGALGYNWSVPTGATITSGANTNSITVDFSLSSVNGNVVVAGTNACGAGSNATLSIVVNNLPVPTISGPATMCEGTSGHVYTTEDGMTNYDWNVTAGTITSGAGTNSISVSWLTAGSQTVSANYANANGCSATIPASFNVTVLALPVPTISGATVACESTAYLDYTTETGMTNYIWDITPNSGTITQTGTNVVTIFWTAPGAKWVSVSYANANGCVAIPTVYNVTVNPLPGTPGTISGSSSVCVGASGVVFSVTAVTNATTYVWSLPSGATLATGTGTNSVTVNFSQSAVSGDISVLAQNACGNGLSSPTLAVTVNSAAGEAGIITGEAALCQGTSGITYTVAPINGATSYNWSVPAGATIASGTNTNSIIVNLGSSAASGNITVAGSNSCGTGTPSSLAVTVNPKPTTPVIAQNLNILTSNATTGNQWYRDGLLIPGATNQTYDVTENGTYTVVVTLTGCSSDPSNEILMLNVATPQPDAMFVSVYPNPTSGEFWLSINSAGSAVYEMELLNNLGAVVYKNNKLEVQGSFKQQFNFSELPAGMYTISLRSSSNVIVKRIVITK